MSMKSFDKFCENMILGEPASQKEIFDERQKQQRTQLTLEALLVYAVMSALAVMVNESFYTWCAGDFEAMVFCMSLSFLWWVIRNAAKGSLFGVTGKGTQYSAMFSLIWGLFYVFAFFLDSDEKFAVARDGRLTEKFTVCAAFAIYFIADIVVLAVKIRENKLEKAEK